jgi:hypothetical protein
MTNRRPHGALIVELRSTDGERMRAGFYCGPIEHLAGRRALVRTNVVGVREDHVMAQFDDEVSVNDGTAFIAGGTPLNFGWHEFPASVFDLDVEYE